MNWAPWAGMAPPGSLLATDVATARDRSIAPRSPLAVVESDAAEAEWMRLLEVAERCGTGRLFYCAMVKRAIDLAVASIALVVLTPLLLVVALAIRLDSRGPAIFRQTRIGRGERPFTVYKFRTMVHSPGEELRHFMTGNGHWQHKIKDDPRVTRVGRLIRRTSIDELPQLINVIRGEMSLIGPRPELPQIVRDYEPWMHRRHLVRPGLTGWWQVRGRSDLPMHEHTDLDIYYVEHVSWRLDLRILKQTVRIVVCGLGAY
ncbi:MAG: hypothetical protein QOF33_900 [Thermomicrobiales bacterium]|nr:hypothetical protein [Thermomicrobiales bacterium]